MAKKQSKILVTALPLKSMQIANFRDAARQERKKRKRVYWSMTKILRPRSIGNTEKKQHVPSLRFLDDCSSLLRNYDDSTENCERAAFRKGWLCYVWKSRRNCCGFCEVHIYWCCYLIEINFHSINVAESCCSAYLSSWCDRTRKSNPSLPTASFIHYTIEYSCKALWYCDVDVHVTC